jgi:hypothetical protein
MRRFSAAGNPAMTGTWLQPAPRLRRAGLSGLRPSFTLRLSGSRSIMDAPRLPRCRRIRCAPCSCRERRWSWPEPVDPAQDLREQRPRRRHLCELEHHVAAVTDDPGANLDQLLAQCRERPMLDPLRQGQCAQEVGEVVGQRVKLEPHRVVPEGVADSRVQRSAFFPSLMCCSAVPRPL